MEMELIQTTKPKSKCDNLPQMRPYHSHAEPIQYEVCTETVFNDLVKYDTIHVSITGFLQ